MKTKVCYPNTGQFRYSDSDEHLDKQAKPNTKQTKKKGCYLKINTQKTYLWNKSVKIPSNICWHFKYDAANWGRVQTWVSLAWVVSVSLVENIICLFVHLSVSCFFLSFTNSLVKSLYLYVSSFLLSTFAVQMLLYLDSVAKYESPIPKAKQSLNIVTCLTICYDAERTGKILILLNPLSWCIRRTTDTLLVETKGRRH